MSSRVMFVAKARLAPNDGMLQNLTTILSIGKVITQAAHYGLDS
jgi:hypothetical protein